MANKSYQLTVTTAKLYMFWMMKVEASVGTNNMGASVLGTLPAESDKFDSNPIFVLRNLKVNNLNGP